MANNCRIAATEQEKENWWVFPDLCLQDTSRAFYETMLNGKALPPHPWRAHPASLLLCLCAKNHRCDGEGWGWVWLRKGVCFRASEQNAESWEQRATDTDGRKKIWYPSNHFGLLPEAEQAIWHRGRVCLSSHLVGAGQTLMQLWGPRDSVMNKTKCLPSCIYILVEGGG